MAYKLHKKKKIVYLKSLATDKTARCRGYASFLINYFKEKVAQEKAIFLFCDPDRVAFYKKRGAFNFKKRKFRKILREYRVPENCVTMQFKPVLEEAAKPIAKPVGVTGG